MSQQSCLDVDILVASLLRNFGAIGVVQSFLIHVNLLKGFIVLQLIISVIILLVNLVLKSDPQDVVRGSVAPE